MQSHTALDTKKNWEKIISETRDRRHRKMLEVGLKHWWAEVIYDIDSIMETVTSDVCYRSYGTSAFGPPLEIDSIEHAKAMYLAQFEAGLMPGGPIAEQRFSCADWGYSMDGLFTMALPGAGLFLPELQLDDEQLYLFQIRMAVSTPFKGDLMAGEILYMGAPQNIEPTDHEVISHLLGWDVKRYKK